MATADWLAEQGADDVRVPFPARWFLERVREPRDQAEWIDVLQQLARITHRPGSGLEPESVDLLAGLAPRPGEPSRDRACWESLVVDAVCRPDPAWRPALACHLLIGLIEGRDIDAGGGVASSGRSGSRVL